MACWICTLGSAYSSTFDENNAPRYFQAFANPFAISYACLFLDPMPRRGPPAPPRSMVAGATLRDHQTCTISGFTLTGALRGPLSRNGPNEIMAAGRPAYRHDQRTSAPKRSGTQAATLTSGDAGVPALTPCGTAVARRRSVCRVPIGTSGCIAGAGRIASATS